MCERYTITVLPSQLETRFPTSIPDKYKPRYNAVPSQFLPIITNKNARSIVMARWGFISDLSKNKTLSPKLYCKSLDTVKSSKNWSETIRSRRCIILADGYYVWKTISKKSKVPYRVISKNGKLICFAGIWEENESENNENRIISFSILTRESYKPVVDLSDSMPVILEQGKELKWLNNDLDFDGIIKQLEIEDWDLLKYYPVSPKIKNTSFDSPELIKLTSTSDQYGNYTLFG